MVGVPSSIGCDACRQQKKKCQVPHATPCLRCTRLAIPCTGYGERRYKWQNSSRKPDNPTKPSSTSSTTPPITTTTTTISRQKQTPHYPSAQSESQAHRPPPPFTIYLPTNPTTALTTAFIATLSFQPTTHHLSQNFGTFILEVPRYLGQNEALDKMADLLISSYGNFLRFRRSDIAPPCRRKYDRALVALRGQLNSKETAGSTETLCAITLLIIVETLLGIAEVGPLTHAGGAAQIIKYRGLRAPRCELERKVLLTIRGSVVFQSLFLPYSFFSDGEWTALVAGYSLNPPTGKEEVFFQPFAKGIRLMQRLRQSREDQVQYEEELQEIVRGAMEVHELMREQIAYFQRVLEVVPQSTGYHVRTTAELETYSTYGILLQNTIAVNCILTATPGYGDIVAIKEENTQLCRMVCDLTECSTVFCSRPLGAMWVQLAVCAAYTAAQDEADKARAHAILEDYVADFMGGETRLPRFLLDRMARYFLFETDFVGLVAK